MRERMLRGALRTIIPRPAVFGALLRTGRLVRPLLPASLRQKIPAGTIAAKQRPPVRHGRRMLMLEGCVQPSLSPNTNAAAARVLDRLGISVIAAPEAGCCGATDYHLNAQDAGLRRARRNIDAWWPDIEAGAEAIVQTASGCGAFVKEYGHLLRDDPEYAAKAARVSGLARDLAEVLGAEALETLHVKGAGRIAFHCPCTLQHAQKLGGAVEGILKRLGYDRKLDALESGKPDMIVTANIGCQAHLASANRGSVRHWIELVEDALPTPEAAQPMHSSV
jgi:glycolate oxidase iron-sulfur subunit